MMNFSSGLTALVLLALLHGCGSDVPPATPSTPEPDHGAAADAHDEHGHGSDEAAHDDHGKETGGEDEHDEHGHGDHEEGEPDFAKLSAEQAAAAGVVVLEASTGVVDAGLLLTGTLIIDPKRIASVRGRFPGLVREMRKEVGDSVFRGETLASVESNESLTVYSVSAPISGVVLERHSNVGDASGDGSLYTIADTGALQAELLVFPSSFSGIKLGDLASIIIGDSVVDGSVNAILPGLDARTQARRIRVTLDGIVPAGLAAGQFVSARIAPSVMPQTVVVPISAVKQMEGRDVVFVPDESAGKPGYRAKTVELGERGRLRVAIRSGLLAGERFVSEGAFLLKAEIGKNAAADEH